MGRQQGWVIGAIVAVAGAIGVLATGLPTAVWQGTPLTPTTTIAPAEPVVATTITPPTTEPAPEATDAATTTVAASTTTTSLPDRATITVVVGNAGGVGGLASSGVDLLETLGYTNARAADAIEERTTTIVMYAPGFADAAARLATELGLAPTAIDALGPAAVTDADGTFDLVVLLTTDLDV